MVEIAEGALTIIPELPAPSRSPYRQVIPSIMK